jgi:hypothetical protein
MAIGLQEVDGLSPSTYLLETAKRHIDGDITIDEIRSLATHKLPFPFLQLSFFSQNLPDF